MTIIDELQQHQLSHPRAWHSLPAVSPGRALALPTENTTGVRRAAAVQPLRGRLAVGQRPRGCPDEAEPPRRRRSDANAAAGRVRQGGKRGDLLKGIYDAPAITKEGPSVTEDPLLPFVEALAKAADQRKGRSIAAFHVAPLTDVASFVIAACGRSRPQCGCAENNPRMHLTSEART